MIIPTGVRYVYNNGLPSQSISSDPSNTGGRFVTAAGFISDALTVGSRITVNAGLRFDHSQAISQDLPGIDLQGRETGETIEGIGRLYDWNLWSPRLGIVAKLTGDGRTIFRASYGRFYQGVLTGELGSFHPGSTPVTTRGYVAADGGYTRLISTVSQMNLRLDPDMRAPHTDEY